VEIAGISGIAYPKTGLFRDNVRSIERACRITKVERMEHLIASHIQPWRDSGNDQRLDGENVPAADTDRGSSASSILLSVSWG
jgi:hypothetical protein